jgi:hypothetical protein
MRWYGLDPFGAGGGGGVLAGSCDRGNEPSGSIKCWRLLKKVSGPWNQLKNDRNAVNLLEETLSAGYSRISK